MRPECRQGASPVQGNYIYGNTLRQTERLARIRVYILFLNMEEGQKPHRPRIGERRNESGDSFATPRSENMNYRREEGGNNYRNERRGGNYYGGNRQYDANRQYEGYRRQPYRANRQEQDGMQQYGGGNAAYNRADKDYQRRYNQPYRQGEGNANRQRHQNYVPRQNRNYDGGEIPYRNEYGQADQPRQFQPRYGRYQQGERRYPGEYGERMQPQYPRQPYNQQKPQRPAQKKNKKKKYIIPEPILYKAPYEADESIRLNKYLSTAGVCSRREADEHIVRGEVKVNGNVVTELGTKILFGDEVMLKDKVVTPEHKVYVLLNKPKNCVTTTKDPQQRLTVMDIIKRACNERIFPVGRLDRNTTGVLLLTNDGELASKLTHPQYVKKKIYHVFTDRDVTEEDMQRMADGVELSDGPIHADAVSYVNDTDRDQVGIEIHSGRNRVIRRMFEALGYKVKKLDRVYFAGLTKKDLPRGRWRYLTREEVNMLHMGAFE